MDFSWGYNPSQPFSVESALGGPHGMYTFVKAAHSHGIAVILDVVYNHCGPGDLDLWRFDGWSDGDHDGGIYFYDNNRAQTPWGATRPDYGRGEVRQYFRDNALFWLNKYRIDGLRFDSVVNIRNRNGNNIFIERLWRSLKYDEVYISDYQTVKDARIGIDRYFTLYTTKRLHQSLGYMALFEVYHGARNYIVAAMYIIPYRAVT
jgi:1,4-alpha-glucan branching enzyme